MQPSSTRDVFHDAPRVTTPSSSDDCADSSAPSRRQHDVRGVVHTWVFRTLTVCTIQHGTASRRGDCTRSQIYHGAPSREVSSFPHATIREEILLGRKESETLCCFPEEQRGASQLHMFCSSKSKTNQKDKGAGEDLCL